MARPAGRSGAKRRQGQQGQTRLFQELMARSRARGRLDGGVVAMASALKPIGQPNHGVNLLLGQPEIRGQWQEEVAVATPP